MRTLLALALLVAFGSTSKANDFIYEAEAALALAAASQKHHDVALTPPPPKAAACDFCSKIPGGCNCQNCGCDLFHGKGTAVKPAVTFQLQSSGCANGNCPSATQSKGRFQR